MVLHTIFGALIVHLILASVVTVDGGGGSFQERCHDRKNVTTSSLTTVEILDDSCNAAQFLKCMNGICGCSDPANQVFTIKEYQPRRSRRSPKKGSKSSTGKAVLIGAVAGVGAYQVNKALDQPVRISSGSNNNQNKKKASTTTKVGCYSRVGTKCAIDPSKVKVTTTEDPTLVNRTTTQNNEYITDYQKMSECVQDAECKVLVSGDDKNIGICVCRDGYLHNPKLDICAKDRSSSGAGKSTNGAQTCALIASLIFVYLH